mgnify:CR=1 FL=1
MTEILVQAGTKATDAATAVVIVTDSPNALQDADVKKKVCVLSSMFKARLCIGTSCHTRGSGKCATTRSIGRRLVVFGATSH